MIDHKLLTKYETRAECNRIASEIRPILEKELHIFGSMIIGEYVLQAKLNLAKEIFEEIEKILSDNFHADCQMGDCIEDYYDDNLRDDIAELKKKYTEGEQNV